MAEDIIKSLDERIEELESNLLMMKLWAIKKNNKWNGNIYTIGLDNDKYCDSDLEVQDIKDKIVEYKLKKKEFLKNKLPPNEDSDILFNEDSQNIKLWEHVFGNFESLFATLNIKNSKRKTQIKSGLSLIYAIERQSIEKNQLISEVLKWCISFREKWSKWPFNKKGSIKKNILQTDCESANKILWCCNLSMKLKLSKDRKNIIIIR